jgi:metal-responsive CopG/Arc/MetJ family transcriptional regulator
METIQVVLDEPLLKAADRAARRLKVNRSALVRSALREHLKQLALSERETRDREGWQRQPQSIDDFAGWEGAATWPEE